MTEGYWGEGGFNGGGGRERVIGWRERVNDGGGWVNGRGGSERERKGLLLREGERVNGGQEITRVN